MRSIYKHYINIQSFHKDWLVHALIFSASGNNDVYTLTASESYEGALIMVKVLSSC